MPAYNVNVHSEINVNAHSKVNLFLDVLGKRADGYHEIATVFAPLELHDDVTINKTPSGVVVKSDNPEIPTGEKSNARKAVLAMYRLAGFSPKEKGVEIEIRNRIPVAAGLGGSATHSAAVMRALNELWNLGLSDEKLVEIASKIGADVPFFLFNKPAFATGIGEKLRFIEMPRMNFVIAMPAFEYFAGKHKTRELYSKIDAAKRKPLDIKGFLGALERGSVAEIASKIENAFESVAFDEAPGLKKIKKALLESGALNACLAGAGPAMFAVARDEAHAQEIVDKIKALPEVKQAFSTTSIS